MFLAVLTPAVLMSNLAAPAADLAPAPRGPAGLDVPFLVDESGDSMAGSLTFVGAGTGVNFPGGVLRGASSLTWNGDTVCTADSSSSGCKPARPRTAFTGTSSNTDLSTGFCKSVVGGTIGIVAPDFGDMVLEANLNVDFSHLAGSPDQAIFHISTGVAACDAPEYATSTVFVSGAIGGGAAHIPVQVSRGLVGVSAGSHVYHVNVNPQAAGQSLGDAVTSVFIRATWYPTTAV